MHDPTCYKGGPAHLVNHAQHVHCATVLNFLLVAMCEMILVSVWLPTGSLGQAYYSTCTVAVCVCVCVCVYVQLFEASAAVMVILHHHTQISLQQQMPLPLRKQ